MNVIMETDWVVLKPHWEQWEGFKPTDTKNPSKLSSLPIFAEVGAQSHSTDWDSFGFFGDEEIRGCLTIFWKQAPGLYIGGIGRMAVDPEYRHNGIATALLRVAISRMYDRGVHVSILWASVLELYIRSGYAAIYKNMMYRPIMGLPSTYNITDLVNLPGLIGTF